MTTNALKALLLTAILASGSASAFAQEGIQFAAGTAAQPTSHASDARCPLDEENFRCNAAVAK